jgi:hypothetical protein
MTHLQRWFRQIIHSLLSLGREEGVDRSLVADYSYMASIKILPFALKMQFSSSICTCTWKINLVLFFGMHHVVRTCRVACVDPWILNIVTKRRWVVRCAGRFIPVGKSPPVPTGRLGGSQRRSGCCRHENISRHYRESNPDSSFLQVVA